MKSIKHIMLPESAKYKYTVLYCMAFDPVTLLLKKRKVMIKLFAVKCCLYYKFDDPSLGS